MTRENKLKFKVEQIIFNDGETTFYILKGKVIEAGKNNKQWIGKCEVVHIKYPFIKKGDIIHVSAERKPHHTYDSYFDTYEIYNFPFSQKEIEVFNLLRRKVPGVGPKKAYDAVKAYGIDTLEKVAKNNSLISIMKLRDLDEEDALKVITEQYELVKLREYAHQTKVPIIKISNIVKNIGGIEMVEKNPEKIYKNGQLSFP